MRTLVCTALNGRLIIGVQRGFRSCSRLLIFVRDLVVGLGSGVLKIPEELFELLGGHCEEECVESTLKR